MVQNLETLRLVCMMFKIVSRMETTSLNRIKIPNKICCISQAIMICLYQFGYNLTIEPTRPYYHTAVLGRQNRTRLSNLWRHEMRHMGIIWKNKYNDLLAADLLIILLNRCMIQFVSMTEMFPASGAKLIYRFIFQIIQLASLQW